MMEIILIISLLGIILSFLDAGFTRFLNANIGGYCLIISWILMAISFATLLIRKITGEI